MAEPISQTVNKRQEQTAESFSTSWRLASRLTVPGDSQHLVTPKRGSCQCLPGD